ncbi:serine hydrolase FSH [Diplogelasinospora grovesii]|uniref:Serine hydrolase FSH n=1 Tax=Diplogelasinospora grovesii TaxID=303347 RepID=A0AAN6N2Q1_9PEZI|nr:serine hydrolase FSH [Diplogelasinospora grovesii]
MRFLCFHGKGMNAQIFEKQTARLRQAVGGGHEFIFINGTIPTEPAPGLESSIEMPRSWVSEDLTQQRALHDGVVEFIMTQGPFDGLMGFSQGGGVAASALVEDARHRAGHFKCAIFLCAAPPIDPGLIRIGVSRTMDVATDGVVINIPTAHIWSDAGDVCPGMGKQLVRMCNEDLRDEFVHQLGHDVPGSLSDEGLAGAVRVIERAIERAKC